MTYHSKKAKLRNGTFCAFSFVTSMIEDHYQGKYPGQEITIMISGRSIHILANGKLKTTLAFSQIKEL